MSKIHMTIGAALLVSLMSSAQAETPKQDDPGKTGADLGYFVGTWRCEEKWSKTDFSPAYDSTATLVATNVTDGVWMAWSYVQDASPKVPHPPKGNDLWGYDPAQKQFIRVKADNFAPGALTNMTSKGFVGDTITWDGKQHTPRGDAPFKHTFKKLDDRTIEGRLFIAGQPFYLGKCTRR